MEAAFSILILIAIGIMYWWDWENPDKKSIASTSFDAETVRLNNERKDRQIAQLHEKIAKLNEENPGRIFYRVGPRIKEHTAEEVAKINFTKAEYERLNAPYASHQRHYFIRDGVLEHVDEHTIKRYKLEEKMRKINRDFNSGIYCRFDGRNMKLINKITEEEIPFNPDEYTLTGD
jgi:tRNA nucleotidyltransferase (CCA-adding enzyme)